MRVILGGKKRHGRVWKCEENRQDLNAYINQSDVSTPRKQKYHSMVCTSYDVTTSKYSKNLFLFFKCGLGLTRRLFCFEHSAQNKTEVTDNT